LSSKIFEYAVLYHPKAKKNGEEKVDPSKLIVDVKRVVAPDEKTVDIMSSRDIPEDYLDKLEQVEIAIRPF
jgi:ABC-type oligopeptide transport system substrate-binding subunit